MFGAIGLLQGSGPMFFLFIFFLPEGVGRKRKTPGQNSSESVSQLEDTTIGDKTQQVRCTAHILYVCFLLTMASHTHLTLLQEQPEKEKEKEKEVRHGATLVSYRAFFRELDVEVLKMLQYGLLSRSLLDSEQQTNVRPLLYSLRGESPLFICCCLKRFSENSPTKIGFFTMPLKPFNSFLIG